MSLSYFSTFKIKLHVTFSLTLFKSQSRSPEAIFTHKNKLNTTFIKDNNQ